jgi:hypothetical protein
MTISRGSPKAGYEATPTVAALGNGDCRSSALRGRDSAGGAARPFPYRWCCVEISISGCASKLTRAAHAPEPMAGTGKASGRKPRQRSRRGPPMRQSRWPVPGSHSPQKLRQRRPHKPERDRPAGAQVLERPRKASARKSRQRAGAGRPCARADGPSGARTPLRRKNSASVLRERNARTGAPSGEVEN